MDYRPDIERLRALAVVSVMAYHFFPGILPGGFVGVDLFFVISGFLISGILLDGLNRGRFKLSEFYRRRIRRILPPLIPVLAFLLGAGAFLLYADEYQQLGRHTVASALFLQNFLLYHESGYFDLAAEKKPLLHLWSLSVEEQFYLLWPLLLGVWHRRGWRILGLILSLLILSMVFNLAIRHSNPSGDFFWSLPRFWELLVGALCAALPRVALQRLTLWQRPLRGLGIILITGALLGLRPGMAYPGIWAVFPTLGAALVILGGAFPGRKKPSFWAPLFESIGRISYPLYLWHWPLLSLGHIITGGTLSTTVRISLLVLTFLLAIASHQGIEKPFRRDATWRGPTLLIALMLALLGGGLAIIHADGFKGRLIEQHNPSHTETPLAGYETPAPDCGLVGASERLRPHCKVFDPKTVNVNRTLVVWGDSSAIAWTPVLLELSRRWQARLIVIGHTSCPPLLAARKTHFDLPESAHYCQDGRIQSEALALIERVQPDVIFFMGALGGYRTEPWVAREDTEFVTDREGREADRLTNQETLQKRLPETLDRLARVAPVIAFRNWPLLPAHFQAQIPPRIEDLLTRNEGAHRYDRAYFESQRRFVDPLLEGQASNRVRLFDPSLKICDANYCTNQIQGIPAYQDRYHITPKAALLYLETLDQELHPFLDPE